MDLARREIERLQKQVDLLENRPDMGCDGKCKDEDCYCGYRKWVVEYDAFMNPTTLTK